jgi:hypothetical protein
MRIRRWREGDSNSRFPPEKDWPYETIVIDLRTLLVRERK